ncbi:MAG: helix-turn-helix transcriptional regulator [Rhodopila sp.]|jgi:hypothetical protein
MLYRAQMDVRVPHDLDRGTIGRLITTAIRPLYPLTVLTRHPGDRQPVSETLHKAQVGRRLRAAIEALGISQAEVAKVLGASSSKPGNWLRGDNYPSEWFVKQFCDRYGITTGWLYRGIITWSIRASRTRFGNRSRRRC